MAIHIMRLLPTKKQGLEDVYVRQSDLIDSYLTQVPVVCSVSLVRGWGGWEERGTGRGKLIYILICTHTHTQTHISYCVVVNSTRLSHARAASGWRFDRRWAGGPKALGGCSHPAPHHKWTLHHWWRGVHRMCVYSMCVYVCVCVYIIIAMCISISICISIYLSIHPSIELSIYLPTYLHLHLHLYLYLDLCLYLYLYVSISTSMFLSLSLSLSLSMYVSMSISMSMSISICICTCICICIWTCTCIYTSWVFKVFFSLVVLFVAP